MTLEELRDAWRPGKPEDGRIQEKIWDERAEDFARSVADRVIFLADGRIQEEGTPAEIFDHPQNPRLQSFLASHFRRELS